MKKLSPRQEAFCLEYAKTGNASLAYSKAGYKSDKPVAVRNCASRLLTNENIQARLKELQCETMTSKIMDARQMQEWLSRVVAGEITDRDNPALLKDKLKAADLLGKMQGAFISRQEVDIRGAVPVVLRDDVNG